MFTKTLLPHTVKVLNKLKGQSFLEDFYLSGGTALALQIGHRESEDLDFFSQNLFDPLFLQTKLSKIARLENVEIAKGTLNAFMEGVKIQFLQYPYTLLESLQQWEGISLSSVLDIACTKLITISMRGSKKDFIDLYFILKQYTLEELFAKIEQKYRNVHYNKQHILKSLVYFEDAQLQPMPRMHQSISWEEAKVKIIEAVKEISFDL